MAQGDGFVGETTGTIARHAGMIGSRGLYHLFLLVGGVLCGALVLRYVADGFGKPLFIVFRVFYSWLGFSGSYQVLTHELGALVGLGLFLAPFVGIMAWTLLRSETKVRTRRRRLVWTSLALCLTGWSAEVPAQTVLAYSHPGARLRDVGRQDHATPVSNRVVTAPATR